MILEKKFWYTRVMEMDGRVSKELTFGGSIAVILGLCILGVVIGAIGGQLLTWLGIMV